MLIALSITDLLSALVAPERLPVAPPTLTHLFLGRAIVVSRREHRQRALDLDKHDRADRAGAAVLSVEPKDLLKQRPFAENRRCALEAVALAHHWVYDIDLDRRVTLQV